MLHAYADIVVTFLLILTGAGLIVILIAHWLDARDTSRRPVDHRTARAPEWWQR